MKVRKYIFYITNIEQFAIIYIFILQLIYPLTEDQVFHDCN